MPTAKLNASRTTGALRSPARPRQQPRGGHRCRAAQEEVTGLVFQPFEAVQDDLTTVKETPMEKSFARAWYHQECEAAMNEQINIEYTISYVYHSLYSYFDRDNVGLPGFAAFFKNASDEERGHAELLMQYQTKRGGRVKLQALAQPLMEYNNEDKGDALYSMELALSLEKLNFQKLQALHQVAAKHDDASMCDFIESQLLEDQVNSVKEHAIYVSQLRRIGKGLAVYMFDRDIGEQAGAAGGALGAPGPAVQAAPAA